MNVRANSIMKSYFLCQSKEVIIYLLGQRKLELTNLKTKVKEVVFGER